MTNAGNVRTNNPMCERLKQKYTPRTAAALKTSKKSDLANKIRNTFDPFEMYEEIGESVKSETARKNAEIKKVPAPAARSSKGSVQVNTRTASRARKKSFLSSLDFSKSKGKSEEIKVNGPTIPFGFLFSLILLGILLMIVIFTYSQTSAYQKEISELKAQKAVLLEDIANTAIEIERRDDIRVIENVASKEIGMIKGDTVEKKFITISGGERIEVIENNEDAVGENDSFFSSLLSALTSGFSRIGEYFN